MEIKMKKSTLLAVGLGSFVTRVAVDYAVDRACEETVKGIKRMGMEQTCPGKYVSGKIKDFYLSRHIDLS